ncbi:MAG TPA: methylase, partial [Ruminococcus sp.]|nr:methylase [Ruminococcus sp.]
DFDWSGISPTIFGAVFESTLNPETRRSGGMHYTSLENIHKVIDPLFLDDLKAELETIKQIKTEKIRKQKLQEYRKKLASLTFLDPACGSGNFLTETYISLRRLENDALFEETHGQMMLGATDVIQVGISQFYGIEINDFAVTVAKTALWIAESQMMQETEELMQITLDFLPLKSYANIMEANALRIDWKSVVPKEKLSYIMGNPPFVGSSMMNKEQKQQAVEIFGNIKLSNSIDYVGAWYFKACDLMKETNIKAALVSTNSITQGEQVAPLWGTLFERFPIHIDFAHKTFRWDSEANLKAHVHCVIIGFSLGEIPPVRRIFDNDRFITAENINAYLVDAPNVFITSRSKPICAVPKMTKGNQPTDGGNFILSETEKEELIQKDSSIACCIRRYIGAKDFLNNNEVRYCLWLKDVSPSVYRHNKEIQRRLAAIKEMRANSTAAPTRKFAEKPYLFFSTPQTDANYLIIPRHSSENRRYIPIGFMTPEYIASDACAVICDAELYLFGILMSNVHNAWMRVVAGRLKSDYRYSGNVVYNNFPWCSPTPEQKAKIEKTAQMILDARAKYPDCSLADLYDETTMPPELRKAHQANDKAVMLAYGFDYKTMTESECVAELMKLYQKLTEK